MCYHLKIVMHLKTLDDGNRVMMMMIMIMMIILQVQKEINYGQ